MNGKRFFFWLSFAVILGLIIWGLMAANNRPAPGLNLGTPAAVTTADHVTGSANPKVTLIEYGDFECPACSAYAPIVERLITEASSTLRVVFRHFPLPQHVNAMISAQATEAASLQGKFWEMYRVIYANQSDWANLSLADARQAFAGYADDLGLNKQKFAADIDSPAATKFIDDELTEGQSLGINGTPTFFVNGQAIQNPQSYEQFKAVIDEAAK